MLDNHEKLLDIRFIDNNPYLLENHINTTTGIKNKAGHLTESTQKLPGPTTAKTLLRSTTVTNEKKSLHNILEWERFISQWHSILAMKNFKKML